MQIGRWSVVDNLLYYDDVKLNELNTFIKPYKSNSIYYGWDEYYDEYNVPNYQVILEFIFSYKDSVNGNELKDLLDILQLYFKNNTENNLLIG